MAQASSWWQQIVKQLFGSSSLPEFKSRAFQSLSSQYSGALGFWLLGLSVALAMLICNWKLLLATSIGLLVMWLVWKLQACNWQLYWATLRRIFGGANRQLTIAVGSGGLATLSTYTAVSIGVDTDSPWIATGAMLQGLGTLAILVLLVWQMIGRQVFPNQAKLDRILADLTAADPLKRLIAVRHLTRLMKKYDEMQQQAIADYFRLMLNQEQESIIRAAVLDGLETFNNAQKLAVGNDPLAIPLNLKRSALKSPLRISENV